MITRGRLAAARDFICSSTAIPSSTGMFRSSTIRSGILVLIASRASRPLEASVTAKPSDSSAVRSIRRIALSSSVIRIDAGFILHLGFGVYRFGMGGDFVGHSLKCESKPASLARFTFHFHRATVGIDDFFCDGESKPGAAGLIFARDAIEPFENPPEIFGRDS